MLGYHHYPREQTHPLGAAPPQQTPSPRADTPPPREQTPPQNRHPPGTRHTPREQKPPRPPPPPGAQFAGRYGQRAGGTHPTGMQSCLVCVWIAGIYCSKNRTCWSA